MLQHIQDLIRTIVSRRELKLAFPLADVHIRDEYRVFHNCWNKAIGHKSRILNNTTMMITFIERWKDTIL